ncbi:MAG: CapA family protein [bacterium]
MWKCRFLRAIDFTVIFYVINSNFCFIGGKVVSAQNGQTSRIIEPSYAEFQSEVSIVAVGDVMLGSWVTPLLNKEGSLYPFEPTLSVLKSGDVTIANLEAPFTVDGEPFEKKFNFKVPPKYAYGLKEAGFTVVTLANNHIMDFGETGLFSTMCALEYVGVQYCGAGWNLEQAVKPAVVEISGRRIALFGYSMTFPKEFYATEDSSGTAYPVPDLMVGTLKAWEDSVDFTVVSFHWSAEKLDIPKDYQIYFAHLAIDSGADLVLGHHPHVLQGIELYKNRLIAYSLGNFVFGSYSKDAVASIMLKTYLHDDGLFYAQCIPINVDNREVEFQPRILNGDRKAAVIKKLQRLSLNLNSGKNLIEDSGMIFGEWGSFYDEWLQETVVSSYWNFFFKSELSIESNTKVSSQTNNSSSNSTH